MSTAPNNYPKVPTPLSARCSHEMNYRRVFALNAAEYISNPL